MGFIIGITYFEKVPLTKITIAVKNDFTGYIDTKPIHGSQIRYSTQEQSKLHNKYNTLNDYTFYGIEVKPNRELYNQIYMFGENVLLVTPENIRHNMIKELSESLGILNSIHGE